MANAVVDVAIGLVLMYLVLSIICTIVNEFIATWLKLRATTLRDSLAKIIDVPVLKNDFYNHGLIGGVTGAIGGVTGATGGVTGATGGVTDANQGNHVSYLSGQTFAWALLGSLDPTKPLPAFGDIESAVKNLPDSNIRDTLLAQVVMAQGDLEKLRNGMATWFDHAMDRVSGVYKRYLKWLSLAVGLALALVINADSLKVGTALWRDGALREQMAQTAATFIASAPSQTATASAPADTQVALSQVIQNLRTAQQELRPLPLGWQWPSPFWHDTWLGTIGFWGWKAILKIIGIALTTAALSLGAPFWFDLLSKFMNIRGTGLKPERTEDTQVAAAAADD